MKLIAALCLTLLAGCQSLGLATPKGFDQQLAQAYAVHTAVLEAATTAVSDGAITSADAQQVATQAASARTLLDAARTAEAVNPTGAQNELTLALTALSALQTFLKGVK